MADLYRLRIDLTYSSNNNATTAQTNINNVLSSYGRAESAARNQRVVSLLIVGLEESTAKPLMDALVAAWGATTRTGGKVSLVRSDDLTT